MRGPGPVLGVALLSLYPPVRGQVVVEGERAASAEALFRSHQGNRGACYVKWTAPELDFRLRFVLNFRIDFPLGRFTGDQNVLATLLKVTPSGGETSYLAATLHSQEPPPEDLKKELFAFGTLLLGEGSYRIQLLFMDTRGHYCTAEHGVRTPPAPEGKPALPAGMVSVRAGAPWNAAPRNRGRMSILLHTGAPFWRGLRPLGRHDNEHDPRFANQYAAGIANPSANDRAILLDTVETLLRTSGYSSYRLVAYSLDLSAEILRDDHFDRTGLDRIAAAIENLQLGKVTYEALKSPQAREELLARIVNTELATVEPGDAVVLLNWATRYERRLPKALLATPRSRGPVVNLQLWSGWTRGMEFPDVFEHVTEELGGRTFRLHDPAALASAIGRLRDAAITLR